MTKNPHSFEQISNFEITYSSVWNVIQLNKVPLCLVSVKVINFSAVKQDPFSFFCQLLKLFFPKIATNLIAFDWNVSCYKAWAHLLTFKEGNLESRRAQRRSIWAPVSFLQKSSILVIIVILLLLLLLDIFWNFSGKVWSRAGWESNLIVQTAPSLAVACPVAAFGFETAKPIYKLGCSKPFIHFTS